MTLDPAEERQDASLFDPSLVRLGLKAPDRQSAISVLAETLLAAGKVRPSYLDAVLAREAEFPTGLPTPGAAIAIPHTDADHCIEPAVAVGILQDPVDFEEMGSPGTTLPAHIVFLLSVISPEDHVQWLSRLASAFQTPDLALELLAAQNPEDACLILQAGVEG